jgi:hypothetical protein
VSDARDLPAKAAKLDRSALERVLARAAELQAADGDSDEPGLSDAQLVEIAREVGLAPANLRQALAEERSRLEMPPVRGVVDRVFGPAIARAMRTLPGRPPQHMRALDAFMQQEEGMRIKRQFDDRLIWERAAGLTAHLKRTFDVAGRGYHLTRAEEVSAIVVAVDAERTLVRLEASLVQRRAVNMSVGAALAGFGVIASGALLLIPGLAVVAAVPVVAFGAGGWALAHGHRRAVERAQLALEQVLDRLERNDKPRPSLLDAFGPEPRLRLLDDRDR